MHSLNSFYPTKHKDSTAFLLPFLNSFLWLRDLDLSFCNLSQVPDAIGWLHGLEVLNLGGNNFDRLPSSIKQLSKLTSLDLQLCRKLKSCPELPTTTILPTVMRSPIELYISNCPKLHEMECWNSVAFPWMLQVIQAQQESSNPIGVIDIFIPGSQIPRWYNIQSVGDSMNLDPSGVIHDSNWIVVSFCIAFPTCNLPTLLKNNCRAEVFFQCPSHPAHRGGRYYTRGNTSLLFGDPTTDKYLSMVKEVMDHLFIFYMTRENFISSISCLREENCNLDLIDFSFLGQHQHGETGNTHVYAKKHGLRWVYKQDLEQLKANKSSSTHVHDGDFGIGSPILSSEPANSSA
ncbi:hypothetical protein RIF29_31224 [Crotalaria pallida]|uniref:Uncharacterized protein n=1 Tax=Crotalaria pallida TaxID=3830 RepID=A0AAN9HYP7_CROPI